LERELEKAFLSELEALEKFRMSYSGMYPSVPLAREDPDVRRLLEAMAYFTARTRLAAERNVDESLRRILRQHFPYLLSPVPAMVMLRAVATRRYVDVSELPRGSEVNLVAPATPESPERVYRFRTLADLRILPIEIEGLDTLRVGSRGHRLLLRFAAAFPRSEPIGELELHVDYLNDLQSSLVAMHELRTHVRSVSVVYSHRVDETTPGEPCTVEFGPKRGHRDALEVFEHPLQRVRAALHFPQQGLYLRVKNLRAPRDWQKFTVVFDMDDGWPPNLRLNAECFRLHVVPMANIRRETASPIECDGTQSRYLAQHPDRVEQFVPLSVQAVYKTTEDGLAPLEPATVGAAPESYEAVVEGKEEERRAFITLNLPDAFENPETVVVDAFWHQPDVSGRRAVDLKARLSERFVDGVEWQPFGPLAPHADVELDEDRASLLELLSIKAQRLLGLEELRFFMRAIGVHRERPFAKLATHLASVRIVDKPNSRAATGFKHVYELAFEDLTASDLPRLDLFCGQLLLALEAWSVDEVVELVASVPNLDKKLRYAPGAG
jgi:type VI secretion system protein ImpG